MFKYVFFCLVFFVCSFYQVSAATEIVSVRFYTDIGNTGVTTDGRMFEDRYKSWSQTIDSVSARITSMTDSGQDLSNTLGNGNGMDYYGNNRLHFGFDTSSLPDNANIVEAKFVFYGINRDDSSGSERRMYLVSGNPEKNNTLVTSDYSKVGSTSFGVTNGIWVLGDNNTINFNNEGIAWIKKDNVTNFVLRGYYDFNRVVPTNENELHVHIHFVEADGIAFDPYLEVTYEIPDEPVEEDEGGNMYDLTRGLIAAIEGYSFSGEIEKSYVANLKKVEGFLNSAKYTPAENQVRSFVKKLVQDYSAGKISKAAYDDLLARANLLLLAIPDDAFGTVPLITQVASPYPSLAETGAWASAVYAGGRADKVGDCGRTIAQCGCAITSLSMMGKSHGIGAGFDGTAVNPLNMNNWLLANGGYSHDGSVLWNYALAYMGEEKNGKVMSRLSLDGYNTTNPDTIKKFIDNGNPSLGFSAAKGHFITLTGTIDGDGYSINDPLWYNTRTTDDNRDVVGKVQDYNNVVTKANLFGYSSALKPLAESVEIVLESPAELLVIDEKGRRLGYDTATEMFVNEIPGGTYDREDFITNPDAPEALPHKKKRIYIAQPEGELFDVRVIGTGEGEYHLSSAITDGAGGLFGDSVEGIAHVGSIDGYTVTTLRGTAALPVYLQDIVKLIPIAEQKKFVQTFAVIAGQVEKDHVVSTAHIVENLIRYIEEKYSGKQWTVGVIAALREISA